MQPIQNNSNNQPSIILPLEIPVSNQPATQVFQRFRQTCILSYVSPNRHQRPCRQVNAQIKRSYNKRKKYSQKNKITDHFKREAKVVNKPEIKKNLKQSNLLDFFSKN